MNIFHNIYYLIEINVCEKRFLLSKYKIQLFIRYLKIQRRII